MKDYFRIQEAPVILLAQIMTLMIFSDIFFFTMLSLVDFAHRDSLLVHILTAKEELIGLIMVFQLAIVLYLFLSWIFNYYYFKGDLLIHKRGIIWTTTDEYILSEVEVAIWEQGFFGKIFNFGTIKLFFSNQEFVLKRIPNPDHFVKVIKSKKTAKKHA